MEPKYKLEYWDSLYKEHQDNIEVVYGLSEGEDTLIFDDIDKTENVIISGTAGSGKSVFLHSFIKGAMKYHTPEDIKFALVDPKHIEFWQYRDSKFLYSPIVKDREGFLDVVNSLVKELENRKQNNINSPRIALVVDEYCDLVFDNMEEVESSLSKLLKNGHRYGIHVFIALQRISFEDIISKKMISLFRTRICQLNYDKEESIFLVGKYLEGLKGQGDSLVLRDSELVRVQGLYDK